MWSPECNTWGRRAPVLSTEGWENTPTQIHNTQSSPQVTVLPRPEAPHTSSAIETDCEDQAQAQPANPPTRAEHTGVTSVHESEAASLRDGADELACLIHASGDGTRGH